MVGLAERGDVLVLSLAGELDLAEVTFVDSTVLGALVEARSKLGGDAFALAAPGLEVRRALEVSGLDRHFTIETLE